MRTALCLYGQPRSIKQNWKYIQENIVNPNNADIFLHTWFNPEDLNLHKMTPGHEYRSFDSDTLNFINGLNILSSKIEKQIDFNDKFISVSEANVEACWPWSNVYDREDFIRNRVRSHYSMWYSINQSIMLKEMYSQQNRFEYDCVILSRFDTSPKISVDVSKFDNKNLNSGYHQLPRGEVNDWFMFSNNINMNIVGSTFLFIDYYRNLIIDKNEIWTNEAYLRDQLRTFNINVDYHDLNVTF